MATNSLMKRIDCGERRDQYIISFAEVSTQTATLVTIGEVCDQIIKRIMLTLIFLVGGSSRLSCTDTYMGPTAFSEKETKAVMDFYATIASKSDAYISFHSAAEMLLYPMGHTNATDLVPNVGDLVFFAQGI